MLNRDMIKAAKQKEEYHKYCVKGEGESLGLHYYRIKCVAERVKSRIDKQEWNTTTCWDTLDFYDFFSMLDSHPMSPYAIY